MSSLKDPITTKLLPLVQIKTNLRVGSSFVSVGVVASAILLIQKCLRGSR